MKHTPEEVLEVLRAEINQLIKNEDALLKEIAIQIKTNTLSKKNKRYVSLAVLDCECKIETEKSRHLRKILFNTANQESIPIFAYMYKSEIRDGLSSEDKRIIERLRADLHKRINSEEINKQKSAKNLFPARLYI